MSETEQISSHSARLFADKYENATSESQLGQSFWRDFFLTVVGVSDLLVAGIEFEFPIRGKTGTIKFIDCLWPGVLLVEHKSAGKNLDVAEEQARDYLEALPTHLRPPTLIVSDFRTIRIVNILRGSSHAFPLTELPENLDRVHAVIAHDGATSSEPRVEADKKAVKLMGELFIQFEKAGYEGHELSVFLIRILFLNFGDDTRMWKYTPDGLFGSFIQDTYPDGTGLGGRIQELFQVLNTPRDKRPSTLSPSLVDFPYVNGGLFSEQLPIFSFTADMREALIATTSYDWSNISPAIFGAMFQTVKDKADRRESGEFYTSEKAIMRVISPLFLDGLNARLQKAWASAPALKRLWADVGKMNFLDPASGSGNFLLVAYKKLRELELKLMARLNELEGRDTAIQIDGSIGLQVHLGQFHAIEYDEWSSQIAFVAMFLADHQSNRQMEEILGVSPERFPLTESAVVKQGNALTIPWDAVCPMGKDTYIMGNPPFNGYSMMTERQREDTATVWEGTRGSGVLDYVASWFLIGAKWADANGVSVGFVATNSITQGEQPPIIWKRLFQMGIEIDFAYKTFNWDAGVGVHVVIIGFSTKAKPRKRPLWKFKKYSGEPTLTWADNISPYLVDAPSILVSSRTSPIVASVQKMDYGSKPTDGGYLSDISPEEAEVIRRTDPIASKYLRQLIGAKELSNNSERYCLWLVGVEPAEIRKSPELSARVSAVREFRLASKKSVTRRDAEKPHEFQEIRQPAMAYIAVPLHTTDNREYVPMTMCPPELIVNNSVSVVPDGSFVSFGILMSRPFNLWLKAVSGRLRQHPRISGSITYNNFPFPETGSDRNEDIEAGAQAVLAARDLFPSSSLSDLYDPKSMPSELRKAHQQLDKTVLLAFGLKFSASDEEVLAEMFMRYDDLTRGLLDATTVPKRRARKTL
jgi:hypothetical protein